MKLVPPIAVLGLCERAARVPNGHPRLHKWNLLGLKTVVPSFIFPTSLHGASVMFAFSHQNEPASFDLVVRGEDGKQHATITVGLRAVDPETQEPLEQGEREFVVPTSAGWTVDLLPGGETKWLIPGPGVYTFYVSADGQELPVGSIQFALALAPALTPERIAAIRSDPRAAKAVRVDFSCNKCSGRIRAHAGLERSGGLEKEGYVWYQDLPLRFQCGCGQLNFDLESIRTNLHAILGSRTPRSGELSLLPLYEKGVLDGVAVKFRQLLDSDPPEETLQTFFDQNPILLHEFSPELTLAKAPVLTKYKTDFAIVNSRCEMILIELEKAGTRLMTSTGGVASPLQHALDQVHDWLQVFDDHRVAALDCLRFGPERVGVVKAVVIAGRDASYAPEDLRSLKARDFGRVKVLTYDDVLNSLINVQQILADDEQE